VSEILIVDDERDIRELLSEWLAAEGFSLSEAADAESALSVIGLRPIAAVLVDKDMPGHDGTWLIEQIRRRHPAVRTRQGDDRGAARRNARLGSL